jgi:branched-chain amino acid transport system substrate-binding protein
MAALRKVQVADDPRGLVKLDELGNPLMNVYIRKVERKNGKLVNSVIKTYPSVSQFWNYDKAAFLAAPVYSRDYPVARNLQN